MPAGMSADDEASRDDGCCPECVCHVCKGGRAMSESVADALWSMLASAGVKRCYGIVGDALNPVIDALRRDGRVEFIQVRNEEAGVLAAVAEASLTGNLVAVCGTARP